MAKRKTTRKQVKPEPKAFTLDEVNPRCRVDVLAAKLLDRTAEARGIAPLISSNRSVIHAALNSALGPHVIPSEYVEAALPFVPLIAEHLQRVFGPKEQAI